jgi:hypothetical protein
LRGRIEDITGWALLQDNNRGSRHPFETRHSEFCPKKAPGGAFDVATRSAQEAVGNSKDALEAYIKSYSNGDADVIKYGVIESIYQKVNGNTDGLEAKIGAKPASIASNYSVPNASQKTESPTAAIQPTPETKTEAPPTLTVPGTPQPIAETKPMPQVTVQETPTVKIESAPVPEIKKEMSPVRETKPETKEETKPETKETVNNQTPETKSKPLFEPIIINVPKAEPLKKTVRGNKTGRKIRRNKTVGNRSKASDKNAEARPRVVREKLPETVSACKLILSEDAIFITGNGGTASFPIALEGEGDPKKIKVTPNSPKDLEATLEPETDSQSKRASFLIKSISRKTGVFTITFESECGSKEIFVEVR